MQLGLKSFLMVGVMSVLFIVALKVILTKYPISGLSEIAQAV